MSSPFREWAARAALAVAGMLGAVIVLEAALQAASLFVGSRAVPAPSATDQHVVLCAGDSHTYGVYCRENEAYPGRLQLELDERAPGLYRVLNLGLPGMNTSQIRASLPEWVARYRPLTVIVGAGANNFWNTSQSGDPGRWACVGRWLQQRRVSRLATILRYRLAPGMGLGPGFTGRFALDRILKDNGRTGVDYRDADTGKILARHRGDITKGVGANAQALVALRQDFEAMYAFTTRHGVRLVLLTYAAFPLPARPDLHSPYGLINEEMRAFARDHPVEVVDLRESFLELLAEGARSRYFVHPNDAHPNPRGYAHIAARVAEVLEPRS